MLYRRRYRVQLQESRALLSEEFGCVAEYLRRMQAELGAPQPDAPRYRAVTGICTAGRHGPPRTATRGACFPARGTITMCCCATAWARGSLPPD